MSIAEPIQKSWDSLQAMEDIFLEIEDFAHAIEMVSTGEALCELDVRSIVTCARLIKQRAIAGEDARGQVFTSLHPFIYGGRGLRK